MGVPLTTAFLISTQDYYIRAYDIRNGGIGCQPADSRRR
jgi:hypothetical protein